MNDEIDLMTAIITLFDEEGKIDYQALKKLTEHLLSTTTKAISMPSISANFFIKSIVPSVLLLPAPAIIGARPATISTNL